LPKTPNKKDSLAVALGTIARVVCKTDESRRTAYLAPQIIFDIDQIICKYEKIVKQDEDGLLILRKEK
jgi:hypothetical protein